MADGRRYTDHPEHAERPVEVVTEEDVVVDEAPVSPGFVLARRIVYLVLDFIEVLLALRFILKLLAANPAAAFVSALYALTEPLVVPFQGIFPQVAAEGSVIEWATLLAMAIYALVFWGIMRLLWIILGLLGASGTGRHVYR